MAPQLPDDRFATGSEKRVTQGAFLGREQRQDKYGFVHISTGDILRENVKKGTELGKKAPRGTFGAVDRLMQDDVKEKGCLLDGFPRAPDQAQAMVDAGLEVEKFLVIKARSAVDGLATEDG
eukprot:Skav226605  [mRNA]  locus=scaffold848:98949:101866:+ [translate_table: standard]